MFNIAIGLLITGWLGFTAIFAPAAWAGERSEALQTTPGLWNSDFGMARGCSWLVLSSTVDADGRIYFGLSGIGQTCGNAAGAFFRYNANDQSFTSLGSFSGDGSDTQGASIQTLVYHDGAIYVGGAFVQIDGLDVNGVARFDLGDETWSGFGSGLASEGALSFARDLLVTDEEIWVGGGFTQAGDVQTTGVARFDRATNQWQALGDGLDNAAWALALDSDGILYVGGQFTQAGGQAAPGLATWDGNDWSNVGSFPGGTVRAVTLLDDRLYVGGVLAMEIEGTSYNGVLSWDGDEWTGLGTDGLTGDTLSRRVDVTSLATHQGELYVGGIFQRADGIAARNLARWSPTSQEWSNLGSGEAIGLRTSLVSRILGYGALTQTIHDDGLYVGGLFVRAGGEAANNVARFDLNTNSWAALGTDSGQGLNAQNIWYMSVHGGEVVASGVPTQGGTSRLHSIGRWNPVTESWSPFGGPQGPAFVGGVNQTASAGGSVFAASTSIIQPDADAIEVSGLFWAGGLVRWDEAEQNWIPVETDGRDLTSFSALLGAGELLYGAGSFTENEVTTRAVRVWDTSTSTWSAVGSNPHGWVNAMALGDDGSLYIGGAFENVGTVPASGIARWDPINEEWSPLGSGLTNTDETAADVRALAVGPTGDLYAGGRFDIAGGVAANNIARWDGTQWQALGDGITDADPDLVPPVMAMVVADNGEVFVGGRFTDAGGQPARHLARWDGEVWSVIGNSAETNGVDRVWTTPVRGLALLGADLFVAGGFGQAGEFASAHFAKFTRDLGGASIEMDIDVEELSSPPGPQSIALMTRSFQTGLRYTVDVRNPGQNMARNVDFKITADPAPEQVEWTCQALVGNAVCPASSGTGLPNLVFNLPGLSTLRFEILVSVPEGSGVYEQTLNASSILEPVFPGDAAESQSSSSTLVNDRIFRGRFQAP